MYRYLVDKSRAVHDDNIKCSCFGTLDIIWLPVIIVINLPKTAWMLRHYKLQITLCETEYVFTHPVYVCGIKCMYMYVTLQMTGLLFM